MLNHPPSKPCCSAPSHGRDQMRITRCVDCRKPLFSKTWKEKLKGQFRATFLWPSKKRQDVPVGRYIVKQRCGECQEPLRCSECTEAFFGNLSPDEIKVFIKAMVLFAMKGLCMNCNQSFRFVYHELFDDIDSCAASSSRSTAAGWEPSEKQNDIAVDGAVTNPRVLSEIQALGEFPEGGRMREVKNAVMEWKGGVVLRDWKREMNDLLSNRFHLVLER